jgi:hypothetical protein
MQLSHILALVLSALPLATAYTELLTSKLRSPWPVNVSPHFPSPSVFPNALTL